MLGVWCCDAARGPDYPPLLGHGVPQLHGRGRRNLRIRGFVEERQDSQGEEVEPGGLQAEPADPGLRQVGFEVIQGRFTVIVE